MLATRSDPLTHQLDESWEKDIQMAEIGEHSETLSACRRAWLTRHRGKKR